MGLVQKKSVQEIFWTKWKRKQATSPIGAGTDIPLTNLPMDPPAKNSLGCTIVVAVSSFAPYLRSFSAFFRRPHSGATASKVQNITPCTVVDRYQLFRWARCLHLVPWRWRQNASPEHRTYHTKRRHTEVGHQGETVSASSAGWRHGTTAALMSRLVLFGSIPHQVHRPLTVALCSRL